MKSVSAEAISTSCSTARAANLIAEFREGAIRIVRETAKPIAQIGRDLGLQPRTIGNWVANDRAENEGAQWLSIGDVAELKRLRAAGE